MSRVHVVLVVILAVTSLAVGDKKHHQKRENKYSADVNLPESEKYDMRQIQRPFRMAKLNLVWTKAQHRLTEPKLISLYTELKIQDKEELAWKQLSGQNKDKDGLKEAELRKKLIGIMSTYGLLEHFDETQNPEKTKEYTAYHGTVDSYKNKSLFKDKKLNRLWEKAEVAGFTPEELKALKEEFMHHQEKVDLYYELLDDVTVNQGKKDFHINAVNEDEIEKFNEVGTAEELADSRAQKHDEYYNAANDLREKHRDIRDSYDRLERITAKGPNSQDFVEPKVQGLWRVAINSDFSADELASLKVELQHLESRLLKLRHMNAEHAISMEKYKSSKHLNKHEKISMMEDNIKKQTRKVEKLHEDLEKRIFKHTEL
ncbi:alpha-2-macroglobulin receptor-associated protein [Lutzomyia longipalpis]|uniref:Putative alpha 2-macroglobulin receptor-associated protein n=1 Tax=Lutzomyia longipalpis TaxID=7200 RepID=A0A1B0CW77_LUTLO|nr:alpha-2-macroglobulin receptor-associated protein [Lutzomyia longipalpis]